MRKNNKLISRVIAIILLLANLMSLMPDLSQVEAATNPSSNNPNIELTFDEVDNNYEKIGSIQRTQTLEAWHYSAGEWKVSSSKETQTIKDSQLPNRDVAKLDQKVMELFGGLKFDASYPKEVTDALKAGKKVIVKMSSTKNILGEYIHNIEDITKHNIKDNGSGMEIKVPFKFNYQEIDGKTLYYDDYELNTGFKMPIVKEGFGANGYAIYDVANPSNKNDWSSYWNYGQTVAEGHIHPEIIKPNGYLEPGHTINTSKGPRESSTIKIGHGTFNSGGAVALNFTFPFQFDFYIERENKSEMILRELELIDPETGVIESFKRAVDNIDPMNVAKQKTTATSPNPLNASVLSRDKKYIVRAKYQFISFNEGEFDISKPGVMTPEQKAITTTVNRNELDVAYAYDDKWNQSGVFDKEFKQLSKDKANIELKNLETASFEWEYEVPITTKKYIKIAGIVPKIFAEKESDDSELNNWSTVFARIAPNDIGMHKNVRLINENNEEIRTYKKGKDLRLIFPVQHVLGEEVVGKHPTNNPKVIVNVEITDNEGKVIYKEKVQTPKLLNPKETFDMPITKKFKTDSDKITACATIDPIHQAKGYNDTLNNDKICITFKAGGVDMGIVPPIKLFQGGREVKFVEPNKTYTAEVSVNHLLGDEAVGLNATTNPKVKVRYTVTDAKNRVLLNNQTVQTTQVLNPKGTVVMPKSQGFTSETGMVRVCAEIDPIHNEKGYNFDPTNDGPVCQDFMMVKNYSMRELDVFPKSINFGKNESVLRNSPVTLTFTITNESQAERNLPSNPVVVVKHGNQIIWEQAVSVAPGQSTTRTISIPRDIIVGDNKFSAEVNPYRTEIEFKPGMDNPYSDNKKEVSIVGVRYEECETCAVPHKRNDWQERWNWTETLGNIGNSTYQHCRRWTREIVGERCSSRDRDGYCMRWEDVYGDVCTGGWETVPYQYCITTSYRAWSEVHNYYETFEIESVRFTSKHTKDTLGGSKSVKNRGEGTIKAGYGFELEVKTRYQTNRGVAPSPEPRRWNYTSSDRYGKYPSTACNIITRTPGVTPVYSPSRIYMTMPYADRSGESVCYILVGRQSGSWSNLTTTYELPSRTAPGGGGTERKIYVNENAKPNNTGNRRLYPVKLVTPRPDKPGRFYGYYPEAQVGNGKKSPGIIPGSYLHDCDEFYLVIYPQDDIKSHITQ